MPHDADEVEPGVNARIGYRLHPRFAAELAWQSYAAFEVNIVNGEDGEVEGQAITANLKGYFSTSHYQPYVFIGYGQAETDNSAGVGADGTDSAVAAGVGADYYFDAHAALYVEAAYYHPGGDTDEFDFLPVTVGVAYRY